MDAHGNRGPARGSVATFAYDANGHISSGGGRTYEFGFDDRLTAIVQGSRRTEFGYDGLGRRVRVTEKENGAPTSDRRYVWAGLEVAQEREAGTNAVRRRYYRQGFEQADGQGGWQGFYYLRDHLGSVREVVDASGAVRARYEYGPWGGRTKVSGDAEADFGFTGHWTHAGSGLALAPFREYDPETARWLNRDPIGEAGGINLYEYVSNNPVNLIDPWGLYITYRGGGSQAFWDNYRKSYERMNSTRSGQKLLREAECSDRNIEIGPNTDFPMQYDHTGHTTAMGNGDIRVDLNETRWGQDSFDRASTWRGLPHEIQHALEHAYGTTDPAGIGVNQPGDAGTVINQMENRGTRAGNIVAYEAGERTPNTTNSRGNPVPRPWGPYQ